MTQNWFSDCLRLWCLLLNRSSFLACGRYCLNKCLCSSTSDQHKGCIMFSRETTSGGFFLRSRNYTVKFWRSFVEWLITVADTGSAYSLMLILLHLPPLWQTAYAVAWRELHASWLFRRLGWAVLRYLSQHILLPRPQAAQTRAVALLSLYCCEMERNCSTAHFRLSFPHGFVEWVDKRWDNVDIQKLGDGCSEETEKSMCYYSFFGLHTCGLSLRQIWASQRLWNWVNKAISVM